MSLNISNKLTEIGLKSIYEKLFDSSVLYNKAFFSDRNTLLKLRLYNGSSYIESTEESYKIVDHSAVLTYYFPNNIDYYITSIRIYNDSILMMEINDLNLNSYDIFENNKNFVILTYEVKEITQCITNAGYNFILRSLVNESGFRITHMYVGKGEPDLSGNTNHLTDEVMNYRLDSNQAKLILKDNIMRIIVKSNDDKFTISDITELGFGTNIPIIDNPNCKDYLSSEESNAIILDQDEQNPLVFTLQSVDFSKFNYPDKYIIEVLFRIL